MSRKLFTVTLLGAALAVSACSQITRERTKIEPAVQEIEPAAKDQGVLQIGDENYRLVRKSFEALGDKPEQPVWRVEVNNWLYQCDRAESQSCMETVSSALQGEITPIAYTGTES